MRAYAHVFRFVDDLRSFTNDPVRFALYLSRGFVRHGIHGRSL